MSTEMIKAIDTLWVLIASGFVFFMQAGFAMVETGFTRAKNASNIVMKNLMDFSVGALIFWSFGFSLMFGVDSSGIIGSIDFFTLGAYEHLGLHIPLEAFMIFQTVFCATAATIVSGAMAERTKFASYLVFSLLMSATIYPVVGHWIWGGGWLSQLGFHDFAGSTVVHLVGGGAALMGAYMLGPRKGKYLLNPEKTKTAGKPFYDAQNIPGHSITLGALGVFILWFGWFGFNGGSTLSMKSPESVSHIFMTTNLAAAAGALSAMMLTWKRAKKPDVGATLNGALGGLVAITAGTDVVALPSAMIIGLIGGLAVVAVSDFVEKVWRIDDPVGAFSVHGGCGAIGTILVGVFSTEGGLLYTGDLALLSVQVVGVMTTLVWTVGSSFMIFKAIDATMGLRVNSAEEHIGLDIEEHGVVSYADFAVKETEII